MRRARAWCSGERRSSRLSAWVVAGTVSNPPRMAPMQGPQGQLTAVLAVHVMPPEYACNQTVFAADPAMAKLAASAASLLTI